MCCVQGALTGQRGLSPQQAFAARHLRMDNWQTAGLKTNDDRFHAGCSKQSPR
jgi:hypothetical protein